MGIPACAICHDILKLYCFYLLKENICLNKWILFLLTFGNEDDHDLIKMPPQNFKLKCRFGKILCLLCFYQTHDHMSGQ